jgi:Carboxypeptidase regulatory-like domain/TonB-dependent Receptor Plug Domain
MPRTSWVRVGLALLLLAHATMALAQNAGSFRGSVTDKTGAVVPGATVSLTNEGTKFARTGQTDAKGQFFFAAVEPGTYSLKAELSGFKTYEAKGQRVGANATAGVDIVMEVGTQSENVVVTAERQLIQNETGAREGLITSEQIENISILGRNPLELLRTLPGVVTPEQSNFEKAGISEGFGNVNTPWAINGARPQNLAVSIDGANLRDIGNNSGMMNVPNNEFVAEVKVQMSNYMAEFGSSAVNIQAVTKSGSAEFHGSVYDYLRDHNLAANDRSRNYAGLKRPEERYQYPGFTLGGPLIIPGTDFNKNRDKAFFFIGFELQRQTTAPDPRFGVVPTLGERNGIFNDYSAGQHLNQPTQVNIPKGFPGAGTPAPGNSLAPYIDPTGRALLNLYPLPNYNDPNNRYNYIFNPLISANRNQAVARIDYNISDSVRTYVRLARDAEVNQNARGLWWGPGNIELPSPVDSNSHGNSAVFNLTAVLSPKSTNEFIFTWSRLKNDNTYDDPSKVSLSQVGAGALQNPFGGSGIIPDIVNEFNGESSLWSAQDVNDIFSYNGFLRAGDAFTKVANTHAIKVGGFVERQYKEQNFQNQNNTQLNFAPWGNGSSGNDFGDILVGRPAQVSVGQPSAVGNFVAWNLEGFVQDSWKVNKNLTLEYGLRVAKWTNSVESNDIGGVFLPQDYQAGQGYLVGPDKRANGWAYVKTGEVSQNLTDTRPFLWMPRLNFAWDLAGDAKTIVRGGGGVFFNREQGNAQYDVIKLPPNAYNVTLDAGTFQNFNGGQGLTYANIGKVDPLSNGATPGDLNSVNPNNLNWPKYYQVSASIARRLPLSHTLEVGYVGNFGRNLAARQNINSLPDGALNAKYPDPLIRAALDSNVINALRPFPAYGNLFYLENIGTSNYNALQATLSKATGKFTYLASYTFSRSLGTVASDFGTLDPFAPATRNYGYLPSDRRHQATFSWTWHLGDPAQGGAKAALLNGWNFSGVSTYSSGQPIRIGFNNGDINQDGAANAWFGTHDHANFDATGGDQGPGDITPVFTCDPRVSGGKSVGDKILNIGCIGIPAFGQTGPFVAPYDLRTPARNFHDITLFKDFKMGGEKRVQLRVGAFNVFNQAYPVYRVNGLNDFDLDLQTVCNVKRVGVSNSNGGTADTCDPTAGYKFSDNTLQNFGKILTKRGHRVVELAVRLFF